MRGRSSTPSVRRSTGRSARRTRWCASTSPAPRYRRPRYSLHTGDPRPSWGPPRRAAARRQPRGCIPRRFWSDWRLRGEHKPHPRGRPRGTPSSTRSSRPPDSAVIHAVDGHPCPSSAITRTWVRRPALAPPASRGTPVANPARRTAARECAAGRRSCSVRAAFAANVRAAVRARSTNSSSQAAGGVSRNSVLMPDPLHSHRWELIACEAAAEFGRRQGRQARMRAYRRQPQGDLRRINWRWRGIIRQGGKRISTLAERKPRCAW